MMPPPLNLKELMQIAYHAGREEAENINYAHEQWDGSGGWQRWWERDGRERHDRFLEEKGDRTVDG